MTRERYLRSQRKAPHRIMLYDALEHSTDDLYRILTRALGTGWPSGCYELLCDNCCSFGSGFGGVFYRRQLFRAVGYLKARPQDMRYLDSTRATGFWHWFPS